MSSRPRVPESEQPWRPAPGDGLKETILAFAIAAAMSAPIFGIGGYVIFADEAARREAAIAEAQRDQAHLRLVSAPALPMLPVERVAHGRDVFLSTCMACHGPEGKGVSGLGKDLTTSPFVASTDDDALHAFITAGRPLARPVAMPPKGGNPDLTEQDVADVVAYLRAVQDDRRMPALPEPALAIAAAPTDDEKAKALAAAGGDEELAEYIAFGSKIYASSCVACHGKDARGLPGNGKDLVNSDFCKNLDDDALLAFLKKGRDPSDPQNTTGVGMPAKGGNPALTDDDLLDVIAYVRSLQTASTAE